jgi:Tfp pilus assembly protein FimT
MFQSLRRRLHQEEGVTLVELMVSMIVAAILIAIMTVLTTMVFRQNAIQENEFDALNEMRFAKAEMVREIRFATAALPTTTPNTIDIWIDRDGSGGTGPDQPGEQVTWQIVGTDLVRFEDGDDTVTRVLVTDMVASASTLEVVGDIATIELTADADPSRPPAARTIRTQVNLRNI